MEFMGYFEYGEMTQHAVSYQHLPLDPLSVFHVADLVRQRLEDAGFAPQNEKDPWGVSPGGHVILRSGITVAWIISETLIEDAGFRIVGVHTGSPVLRVKPSMSPTSPDGFKQIDAEVYGGMLWNSWLDRESAVTGRLLMRDGSQALVRTRASARIPRLAIHLDRTVNSESLRLDPQQHLHPIWSLNSDVDLMEEITKYAGVRAEGIVPHDLVLIPQQGPEALGDRGQLLTVSQRDNLSSVHSGLTASECLAAKGTPRGDDVLAFIAFNHEEIGLETRSGAAGPLLASALERTGAILGRDFDARHHMLAQSPCVSADTAHSVYLNYTERHNPYSRPVMDRGPIVKINANRHHATDAEDIALWLRACKAAEATSQSFASHNTIPCGSTIGPTTAAGFSILIMDVGVGLLSMHPAHETSHVDGLITLSKALETYWFGA